VNKKQCEEFYAHGFRFDKYFLGIPIYALWHKGAFKISRTAACATVLLILQQMLRRVFLRRAQDSSTKTNT